MGEIILLDELTINKIAAGEVIERPASVIKELVENSIDAGANNICIEIKNGGISYIRITDNGKGIAADDLKLAFERHATSKIRQADDLIRVTSMGFRGEALASVAAISNIELVSKTKDNMTGNKIVIEAGKVLEQSETGCPDGTTITVNNIFFNTPVRYKFLKKDFTETGYIEDIITRLALVNTNIAFKLINSGKTILQTNGDGNLKNVIFNIYGGDIAGAILDVDYEYEGVKITGCIGKPEIARSNRLNQIFFVNNRYVKDKTLTAAAEQAYKGIIPSGKFGFTILNVQLDPEKIDVNVHPTKLEIRFTNEQEIFKAVHGSIKDTLLKGDIVSNPFKEKDTSVSGSINVSDSIIEEVFQNKLIVGEDSIIETTNEEILTEKSIIEESVAEDMQNIDDQQPNIIEEIFMKRQNKDSEINEEKEEIKIEEDIAKNVMNQMNALKEKIEEEGLEPIDTNQTKSDSEGSVSQDTLEIDMTDKQKKPTMEVRADFIQREEKYVEEFNDMYVKLFGSSPVKKEEEKQEDVVEVKEDMESATNVSVFKKEEKEEIKYKYIGTAFSTYIIIEIKNEIYIIDQHAAHERIMYEKVRQNFYNNTNKDTQMMLLPDVIQLTHKELEIVTENYVLFEKAGFDMEEFGENTIKLTGAPDFCMELDTKQLFLDILDEIDSVAKTAKQEIEEKFIATIACKASVKANMAIKKEEVEALLEELLSLDNPFSCPHGRPTAIKMAKDDMEKKFLRK